MKWNVLLLVVSATMLLGFAGSGYIEHLMQAEAIAEDLSPRIGVDVDTLREHLVTILQSGSIRRTLVYGIPWAVMTILLTARLIVDGRESNRNQP